MEVMEVWNEGSRAATAWEGLEARIEHVCDAVERVVIGWRRDVATWLTASPRQGLACSGSGRSGPNLFTDCPTPAGCNLAPPF